MKPKCKHKTTNNNSLLKTETANSSSDYFLGNALSFVGFFTWIVIFIAKFTFSVIEKGGTDGIPFFHAFSLSKIENISADWLVFSAILIHIFRIKFGIDFLKYDKTYISTGKNITAYNDTEYFRNIFILFNAVAVIVLGSVLLTSWPCWLPGLILLSQSVSIIIFNWYNKEQLFQKNVDRKSNLIVVMSDFGVLILSISVLYFHVFVVGSTTSKKTLSVSSYFCLISFSVLELLFILLLVEIAFTYKQAIYSSWHDFKRVLTNG